MVTVICYPLANNNSIKLNLVLLGRLMAFMKFPTLSFRENTKVLAHWAQVEERGDYVGSLRVASFPRLTRRGRATRQNY